MKADMSKKMGKLQAMFPEMWFKDGGEFRDNDANSIWTGEGSYIDGNSAFSSYGYSETMGVHPKLDKALSKLDLWAEFYDAGTVFIYPNDY
jgi:hypothetical protein